MMKETNETLQKIISQESELENLKKTADEWHERREKLQKAVEDEKLPLYIKLSEIDAKYKGDIDTASVNYSETEKARSLMMRNISQAKMVLAVRDAKNSGNMEEYVKALIAAMKFADYSHGHNDHQVSTKKTMKNGITIIRVADGYSYGPDRFDEHFVGYLAFFNGKCIGYSGRRKGEHRGDTTRPFSFVFVTDGFFTDASNLVAASHTQGFDGPSGIETMLEKDVPHQTDGRYSRHNGFATFQQWSTWLESFDPSTAKGIDLEDESSKFWIEHHGMHHY